MKVEKTKLKDVLLITHDVFEDHRGEYIELYNKEIFNKNGISVDFIQDDISVSSKHVLRGLHGDAETWKLISCLRGRIYFVVANEEKQWQSFVLSDKNRKQVLVPPNHANGHLALTDDIIFHYKQSTYYNPTSQFTIKYDDPEYNIWWPITNPIRSQRDETGDYI